ncbi:hypothetical protein N0V86_001450 [Didymella sp. IMI 355093]|nr:hypothetical protein N0V86_001450 [Didymella sp. IMI 355093]
MDEATSLLNKFRKSTFPAAPGELPGVRGRTVDSRASSCSFVTAPDKTAPVQRQSPVISQRSNISIASRKRKQIDMSDDEQPDYEIPSPSSIAARKKPTPFLSSPFKKSLRPKGPPPLSASLISPAGKRTNDFGFRAKSTTASPSTPSTPPRPALTKPKVKLTTPVTPTNQTLKTRQKALSTPPSKRKAAVRAQSNVQKIMEADEAFHTEDEIFRFSTRERSRLVENSTTELGTRLRSMSITPVPAETRFRELTVTDESVYTRKEFLKDRPKGGDRLANRSKDIGKLIGEESDDDYEDLDTSEFFFVGGVLLMKGQEGRLTDVQTETR